MTRHGAPLRAASRMILALFLVAAFAALVAPVSAAKQSDFPACWYTGLPPARPNVTVTRCLDAAEWTCCSDCDDQKYALVEASTDGRVILNQIAAGLGDKFTNVNMMVCAQFSEFQQCQILLEQVVCATGCNPDSGSYFKLIDGNRVMQVCNTFSQTVYQTCKGLSLPGIATLDKFFPSAERFMEDLFGKVGTAFGVYNFTVAVTPDGTDATQCYNGPKKVPAIPFCCDPLDVPVEKCPAKVMNFTEYPDMKKYINRTVTDKQCNQFRCSSNSSSGGGGAAAGGTSSSKLVDGIASPTDCIPDAGSASGSAGDSSDAVNSAGSSNGGSSGAVNSSSSSNGGSNGAVDSSSSSSGSSSGSSPSGSSGGKNSNRVLSEVFSVAAALLLPMVLAVL
ncbi:hypothetical protein CLOM_g4463 [Closterium sp. NIES-68]|nr:hypothetical protein CLOM_g4463 [Closterium sp. NIES-68]GJP65330.1 hypothetical protein CLOP_g22228 [Closterium sp. NIES-67]